VSKHLIASLINKQAKHLQIKGLTIEGGRGMGIYMERSEHVIIAGCTIRNVGTSGIFMGQGARLIDENSPQ